MWLNKDFALQWQQQAWKNSRIGILIFCLFQIIFEVIVNGGKEMFIMLIANYLISSFVVKNRIKDGKFCNMSLIKGVFVAFVVFVARVLLHIIYVIYMDNIKCY